MYLSFRQVLTAYFIRLWIHDIHGVTSILLLQKLFSLFKSICMPHQKPVNLQNDKSTHNSINHLQHLRYGELGHLLALYSNQAQAEQVRQVHLDHQCQLQFHGFCHHVFWTNPVLDRRKAKPTELPDHSLFLVRNNVNLPLLIHDIHA